MGQFKAALFDFDGTIIDTNTMIVNSWTHTAKAVLGEDFELPTAYMIKFFGLTLTDIMDQVKKDYNLVDYSVQDLIDIYRGYQANHQDEIGGPYPGMPELIHSLKDEGILLGIVTSRGNKNTRDILSRFDLDIFDAVVGAEDTDIHKPDPYPGILCCQKLGVDPKDCVMIGDSPYDIGCGNRAGTKSIFVKWSLCGRPEDFTGDFAPTYSVETASEILDLIK